MGDQVAFVVICTYNQTGRGAHPASYAVGTASFPEVQRPERGVDHPPLSSAEVEGGVELTLCAFVAFSRVNFTLLYLPTIEKKFSPTSKVLNI
jgi:hypothetical protein